MAVLKKCDDKKDRRLQACKIYVQKLEEDLALHKAHAEDLQCAYNGASALLTRIYDDHKCVMEQASDVAMQYGRSLGMQEVVELGSAIGVTIASLTC